MGENEKRWTVTDRETVYNRQIVQMHNKGQKARVCRYVRLIEAKEERINDGMITGKISEKKNEHIGKKARNLRVMQEARMQFFSHGMLLNHTVACRCGGMKQK